MNILKRTLAGLLIVFLAFGQVTSIPGTVDAVMGFSNLTTVGAIPYVSASGTLSQDSPGIHWDATNNRLGLGTASPDQKLDVRSGQVIVSNVFGYNFRNASGTADGAIYENSDNSLRFYLAGLDRWTLTSAGSTGIGPSNTSPTGTLHVYDATPTTGVTTLTVRAGAGNSASNDIFNVWDGTSKFLRVRGDGTTFFSGMASLSEGVGANNSGWYLGSSAVMTWSSTTSYFGTKDLGLSRSSANNLAITNGSSTNYWLLGAAGIQCGSGDGNSAACDVGTSGARVRNVNAAGTGTFGGRITTSADLLLNQTGAVLMSNIADGVLRLTNNGGNGWDRLQFGGTTSSFPALKRFGNAVAVRAADDTISTFATLTACSASGEGALASISDSATAVWGLVVTGGGSNHILAYCNGKDWTVAAK